MMERRDFITGMLAGAGFASGCRMVSPFMGGESARLKFGVVSDVHVKLAADGRSLAPGYDTQTLERTFTYFRDCGVDAVMIAGDIADIGFVSELKAVADTWFKVFPGDRAPDGRKVERLFVFGNHDAYALQKGGDIFKDPKVLQREAIEADPQRAWDYCFHEEWSPYFKKQSRDLISSARIGRAVFGVTAMPRQGAPDVRMRFVRQWRSAIRQNRFSTFSIRIREIPCMDETLGALMTALQRGFFPPSLRRSRFRGILMSR